MFISINPSNEEILKQYSLHPPEEVQKKLNHCDQTWGLWKKISPVERAKGLLRLAELLLQNKERYAELMSLEMGKPITQAISEIEKCAWVCTYYAEQGPAFLEPETIKTNARKSYLSYQPLGIILAIMPWNFPFWQVIRFAAPTLMAGNAIVLKHAENVGGCALALDDLFQQAFPTGLYTNLFIDHEYTAQLIKSPQIQGVTLTGSVRAGKAVAALAGASLKKTVLELGGSDPYLILEDADLDLAVKACAFSRLLNSGQTCVAAKRLIVVENIHDAFEKKLIKALKTYQVGNPLDKTSDVGPQARKDLREEVHRQVQESIAMGAQCLMGGQIPDGPGYYYPITLLSQVKAGTPAWDEEIFGPVAVLISAENESQAIAIANDSAYGLGAAVFTQNLKRGEEIAQNELAAGSCFLNDFVKSDPRLPFGGVKSSGYGRELGQEGIRAFTNAKTVFLL